MKSFSLKIILYVFFLVLCAQLTSESPPAQQQKTLAEIYKSGEITFKPVLKISLDSIPERIPAKTLIGLTQGEDKLYVSDLRVCDVKILSLDGKFIKSFGVKGKGPSDLLAPWHMCFSKERLVVWEIQNRRFSFFSPEGKFLEIAKPKIKGLLLDMKALDDGRIILEFNQVEGNEEKKEIFEWRVLELYSSEMKHIKTVYRQKEHQFKYFKNPNPYLRMILPFRPKLSWDVLPGPRIAVGFPGKYEIKIMNIDTGDMKIINRDYSPEKVTEADKKITLAMRFRRENGKRKRGADKFYRDNVEFPKFKPAFKTLITDQEGHILVFPYTLLDQGKIDYKARLFDVFDSNGTFVNRVKIKNDRGIDLRRVLPVGCGEFWCVETETINDFDLIWVKYKAM